jgi:hypothetical protein
MIKYRFAVDKEDRIIDILKLDRSKLLKSDKFFSLDYRQELIPRIGKIRKAHFAHKSLIEILGTKETYLHSLGKKIFYDEYSNCLQNETSFYLCYKIEKKCTRLQVDYNIICKLNDKVEKFDLPKYFTKILFEKKDSVFIPDLLLLNPKTNEKIYVEIEVTHSSSESKIISGNRIIEFKICNEEDAERLIEFKNGGCEDITKYYNFKKNTKNEHFCNAGNCVNKFYFFNVSKTGKCLLKIITEKEILSLTNSFNSNSIWRVVEQAHLIEDDDDDFLLSIKFREYISKAYHAKIKVKNCFICRYHGDNLDNDGGEPIFCKFQKITCSSNYAESCKYYKIEQKYVV